MLQLFEFFLYTGLAEKKEVGGSSYKFVTKNAILLQF